MCKKIHLTLLNGTGYIFKVDDYMRLRREQHIVGCLVGTKTERGSAANKFRLPAELTRYETRLLIEQGIAILLSRQENLLRTPTAAELVDYEANVKMQFEAQATKAKLAKLTNAEQNMQKILEGKRKKLQKEGADEAANNLTAAAVLMEIEQNFIFENENFLVEIPCAYETAAVDVDCASTASLPNFNALDELKYRVFCDFWQRGKFVTPGDTFGADFLIYPGDPLIYHASHIVIVLDKQPPAIKLLHLVAKVRVAVIVNKICVLAYAAEPAAGGSDDIAIRYQTIEWDGNLEIESNEISKIS